MNSQQIQDIRLMYEAVYNEELREKANEYNKTVSDNNIVEAGMDMFSTPAYKKSKADAVAKVYTKPVKSLPAYGNAPRGASGPHAADAAVGTQTLIKSYNARSVVPRFPGLTLPEPDNSVSKVNTPKFPSPKEKTERREKPKETPRVTPPAVQKASKVTTSQVVSQKPQLPKTPNPLMVDMPKGPGSMAAPEKPSIPASTEPRTPISPGSFGGGVGTKPTGMSGGTSTVKGLDRSVTSGLTTKPQDEVQKKAREKSALSQRVAGYRSGGPSAGVREEFDLFDYLLEYLVAEGYADTNQDALVIMANLNQEQINDILTERRREERGEPRIESSPAMQIMKKRKREEEGRPEGQQGRRRGEPISQPESPVAKFKRNREYQRSASERAQASSRFD